MMKSKKMINLGLFDSAGRVFRKMGENGKAFVMRMVDGKMVKSYGHKAIMRHQGMVNSMKGIPMANRPKMSHIRRLKK